MRNRTQIVNDHINIETLKAGDDTISKAFAKLHTKSLSVRRTHTAWKNTKMVIILTKENKKVLHTDTYTIKRL